MGKNFQVILSEILDDFEKRDIVPLFIDPGEVKFPKEINEILTFYYELKRKQPKEIVQNFSTYNYGCSENYMGYLDYCSRLKQLMMQNNNEGIIELLGDMGRCYSLTEPRIYYNLLDLLEEYIWKNYKTGLIKSKQKKD